MRHRIILFMFLSFFLLIFSSCFQGPAAMEGRGWASLDMGQYKTAIEYFDTAIEKWSDDKYDYCTPYCGKVVAYTYLGQWEEVIPVCDEIITLDCGNLFVWPNRIDAWPYVRKGIAHLNLEDLDAAMADFDAALGVYTITDLERYEAYVGKGNVLLETGEYRRAIEELTHAIDIDYPFEEIVNKQDYAYYCYYFEKDAYALRGGAYEKLGMGDAATADYARADEVEID